MLWRAWHLFLAHMRWSKAAVCVMSIGRGPYDDFHDYWDTKDKLPWHFHPLKCERCGKDFYI